MKSSAYLANLCPRASNFLFSERLGDPRPFFPRKSGKGVDGHPVDSRAALVRLHPFPGCGEVLRVENLLDHGSRVRGSMLPSATALKLASPTGVLGPLVCHGVDPLLIGSALHRSESSGNFDVLCALRLVSPTTTASADSCRCPSSLSASGATAIGGRRKRQVSPGKDTLLRCTAAAFTSTGIPDAFGVLCHLDAPCRRCLHRSAGRLSPLRSGSIRFLSIGSQLSPSLPSHARSPSRGWLQMVVSFHFWYSYRGLEPRLQRAHAGHTQGGDGDA